MNKFQIITEIHMNKRTQQAHIIEFLIISQTYIHDIRSTLKSTIYIYIKPKKYHITSQFHIF